jgi:hypothetical protein
LKTTLQAYQSIAAASELIVANRKLVELPFRGCPEFVLKRDRVSDNRWNRVMDKLGMDTLRRGGERGR